MSDSNKIILKGKSEMLKGVIVQTLATYELIRDKDVGSIYGIPSTTFQEHYDFYPQIKLYFNQSRLDAINQSPDKHDPLPQVTGEITYRLVGETASTITEAKARARARKIKALFGGTVPFAWNKGKLYAFYKDHANGYNFQLLVTNEFEARRIIERVMEIEGKFPDWQHLRINESKASYPNVPKRSIIYGASRRLPRHRPVVTVHFRWAELHIWGLQHPIPLVGSASKRANALAV